MDFEEFSICDCLQRGGLVRYPHPPQSGRKTCVAEAWLELVHGCGICFKIGPRFIMSDRYAVQQYRFCAHRDSAQDGLQKIT